ncbi:hypothetical protein [Candidatus Thiodubiliella endoseptemdiera]|uniref:Uncharacterized protein n=1 Tax=Candidatus Thiodubiliella endoseptemdiera TaxID=2738886 RepID=A0A853F2W0_9GAMM|nr:hypothetical protein [Candidatus Thiodubiliella endoseptemdiera]
MQLKKSIIIGILSTVSLSSLALMGSQQAQTNNLKPFLVIGIVTLILGAIATYQKYLQQH